MPTHRQLAAAIFALAVSGCHKRPRPEERTAPAPPRAALEILLLDDGVDPMAALETAELPPGVSIRTEDVPMGPGVTRRVHYARIVPQPGETLEQAGARLSKSLDGSPLPHDHRFVLGSMSDDERWGHGSAVAMRTYLCAGAPIERETDVQTAMVSASSDPVVLVTFTPAGGARFEAATTANVRRRLAIVVDGRVVAAPVIQAPIRGGNLSITLGQFSSPAAKRAEAERLARALGAR